MEKQNKKIVIINVAIAIIAVAVIGVAGRFLTDTESVWFTSLNKPSAFIPEAVFPIMWSIIYLAFAVVIFLLLQRRQADNKAIALLVANGVLQLLWSLVYFRLHSLLGGLFVIVFVLAAAIWLVVYLAKKDKLYLYIMLIYPIWLTLATLTNAALWILN